MFENLAVEQICDINNFLKSMNNKVSVYII